MCGRFAIITTPEEVQEHFSLADIELFPPRYNIAPTQPVLVVTAGFGRNPSSNMADRRAFLARWGFIPSWAKDPRDLPLLFNARSETAAEKNAFKAAMRHRRALIPASGFYEWRRRGRQKAQAYWVRPRHGGLVAFAALVETWLEPGGSDLDTAAVLTTSANADLAGIHERMPVVVKPEDFGRWLDCRNNDPRDVADILRPADPGFFEAVPVSDKVNKVANTDPAIQKAVTPDDEDAEPAAGQDEAPRQMKLL